MGKKDRKCVISILYEGILVFSIYLYMVYSGRYGINRVDVGLWFSVSLFLCYLLMGQFFGECKLKKH